MKIYKFGGASVKNAEGVCNLCRIVGGANDKLVVVVSAMGKTTNALEAVLDSFFNRKPDLEACIEAVVDYHNAIVDELFTPHDHGQRPGGPAAGPHVLPRGRGSRQHEDDPHPQHRPHRRH